MTPPTPKGSTPTDVPRIAGDLLTCALSWEPDVCLLGNVTAREIAALCYANLIPAASPREPEPRPAPQSERQTPTDCLESAVRKLAEAANINGATSPERMNELVAGCVEKIRANRASSPSPRATSPAFGHGCGEPTCSGPQDHAGVVGGELDDLLRDFDKIVATLGGSAEGTPYADRCHESWRMAIDFRRTMEAALRRESAARSLAEKVSTDLGLIGHSLGRQLAAKDRELQELREATVRLKGQLRSHETDPLKLIVDAGWCTERYTEMCDRLQATVQRHQLGLGGEHVDELVCEEIDRLHSSYSAARKAVEDLPVLAVVVNEATKHIGTEAISRECVRSLLSQPHLGESEP